MKSDLSLYPYSPTHKPTFSTQHDDENKEIDIKKIMSIICNLKTERENGEEQCTYC